jgi:hypothetical protein
MTYRNIESEKKALELLKQGYVDSEVGSMLGYSPSNIWKIRKKYGIPANKRRKIEKPAKVIFSDDLFAAEKKFSVRYRSKGMIHRPLILRFGDKSVIPSFYDPTTNAFVFILSRQRWGQVKDMLIDGMDKFRFLKNMIIINSDSLEEYRPAALEECLQKQLHQNFIDFLKNS